ncbi:hypothetical protein SAMN05444395_10274 [Flavobacterium fryxellicola]|uniref:Uncharacterized protein n=1 Tax=Flavobacterium fryxellicola TaxID=249352 RepID=A0A167Y971_9FLAO|nr:hypothetical protein [Flavobacterium fryxellicola]OAB29144.1 hypothetical protein FBFR_06800 [Flavobacterium fryxellicola]SHN58008.1 hypothetical protein SAMN05444395_10274 [Flavobacterium fryxellicola]
MKHLLLVALFLFSYSLFAQKPCDYSANVTDSIGTYKSTKEYLISEKNFAGKSSYIFYSLALTDGLPTLSIQLIQKSKDFMKVNCFDKNSKLFLQLNNGKIITLLHVDQENCGTLLRDDKGFDNRINSGVFMFMKGSFEELKNAPVSMMRIKYLTDTEDYILKKEFKSELTNEVYNPETYFINYLHCIE